MAKWVVKLASLFLFTLGIISSVYAQQDDAMLLEQANAAFASEDQSALVQSQQNNPAAAQNAINFSPQDNPATTQNALPSPVQDNPAVAENALPSPAQDNSARAQNTLPSPVQDNSAISQNVQSSLPQNNLMIAENTMSSSSALRDNSEAAQNAPSSLPQNNSVSAQNNILSSEQRNLELAQKLNNAILSQANNAMVAQNNEVLSQQNNIEVAQNNPVPAQRQISAFMQNNNAPPKQNTAPILGPEPVPNKTINTNKNNSSAFQNYSIPAHQKNSASLAKLMSSNQFQTWLQTNGYLSSQSKNKSSSNVDSPQNRSNGVTRHRRFKTPRVLSLEQSQQVMLDSAPAPLVPQIPDSKLAFNTMLQQNMPLSPRQVVRLHQQIDVAQRAASIPATIPPKPVSTTLVVNLAPGTTPPAIRLAQGYVSSLVFVDSTGTAWPIAAFDIGNPKAVNIQWDGKSNILLIQAVSPYSNGDIVVRLVGLPTPVTLELVSGQRVVDYRVDIHVPGIGPNTKDLPIGTNLPSNPSQLLLGVLDGVAPDGSKPLIVPGDECEAWLMGEKIYLRTRLTVLSPGWVSKMSSSDGMQAYELPKTSSVLVSRFGEPVELKIEGF